MILIHGFLNEPGLYALNVTDVFAVQYFVLCLDVFLDPFSYETGHFSAQITERFNPRFAHPHHISETSLLKLLQGVERFCRW